MSLRALTISCVTGLHSATSGDDRYGNAVALVEPSSQRRPGVPNQQSIYTFKTFRSLGKPPLKCTRRVTSGLLHTVTTLPKMITTPCRSIVSTSSQSMAPTAPFRIGAPVASVVQELASKLLRSAPYRIRECGVYPIQARTCRWRKMSEKGQPRRFREVRHMSALLLESGSETWWIRNTRLGPRSSNAIYRRKTRRRRSDCQRRPLCLQ
jgi:hypothetical protein